MYSAMIAFLNRATDEQPAAHYENYFISQLDDANLLELPFSVCFYFFKHDTKVKSNDLMSHCSQSISLQQVGHLDVKTLGMEM